MSKEPWLAARGARPDALKAKRTHSESGHLQLKKRGYYEQLKKLRKALNDYVSAKYPNSKPPDEDPDLDLEGLDDVVKEPKPPRKKLLTVDQARALRGPEASKKPRTKSRKPREPAVLSNTPKAVSLRRWRRIAKLEKLDPNLATDAQRAELEDLLRTRQEVRDNRGYEYRKPREFSDSARAAWQRSDRRLKKLQKKRVLTTAEQEELQKLLKARRQPSAPKERKGPPGRPARSDTAGADYQRRRRRIIKLEKKEKNGPLTPEESQELDQLRRAAEEERGPLASTPQAVWRRKHRKKQKLEKEKSNTQSEGTARTKDDDRTTAASSPPQDINDNSKMSLGASLAFQQPSGFALQSLQQPSRSLLGVANQPRQDTTINNVKVNSLEANSLTLQSADGLGSDFQPLGKSTITAGSPGKVYHQVRASVSNRIGKVFLGGLGLQQLAKTVSAL